MTAALAIDNVSKTFELRAPLMRRLIGGSERVVRAVRNVSLRIERGEVFGLVGESGCGKSTLARVVAGLLLPTAGTVTADGSPVHKRPGSAAGLGVQMVFQNPMASLNPRMTVGRIVGEAPVVHGLVSRAEIGAYVADVLQRVGLDPGFASRRAHELSGGQRQRVGIARALAVHPRVLICDEPIASLDVSIQAHIVNLLMQLRGDLGVTIVFISHDLRIVRHIADRVAIMYLGEIVEVGEALSVLSQPIHPYTQGLLDSIPRLGQGRRAFQAIKGEMPSPFAPPPGCPYHPRCARQMTVCQVEKPSMVEASDGRQAACHLLMGGGRSA